MSPHDPGQLKGVLKQLLSANSFAWLTEKRWFADKGKPISDIEVAALTGSELAGVTVLLSIVEVRFLEGEPVRYFVPMMLEDRSGKASNAAECGGDNPSLIDAVTRPEFGRWLAELLSTGEPQFGSDAWTSIVAPTAPTLFRGREDTDGRPVGGEQSNSSVRVGDDVVVKVLRRMQAGVNPEDEVLQALSGFDKARVSAHLGSLYWHAEDGQQFTTAIAQTWIPNRGDGWTWILDQLRRAAMNGEVDPSAIDPIRDLGVRTAELHVALAAAEDESFGMQPASAQNVSQVQAAFRASLDRSMVLLSEPASVVQPELKMKLPDVLKAMSELGKLAEGFAEEVGVARIRVHGDYHLGQVLRTIDDDWTIIDFEGEPARSLAERRQRSSPLRDVAGMLRSFSYARAVAGQDLVVDDLACSTARDVPRDWERQARKAFIEGYRTTLASLPGEPGVLLVPQSDAAFYGALAAWEADKALYEVAYEARNRPGWIGIPLQAIVPELFDQA